MKRILLTALLAIFLATGTIVIFSCELVDIDIEKKAGAKAQGHQDVVYKQTINPDDQR